MAKSAKKTKPRIPIKDLTAIAQAQVVYIVLIDSALAQIPNLDRETYNLALNLARTQLEHILKDVAKRVSSDAAQKLFDICYNNSQPRPADAEAPDQPPASNPA